MSDYAGNTAESIRQYKQKHGITLLDTLLEYREAVQNATIPCCGVLRNINEQIAVLQATQPRKDGTV